MRETPFDKTMSGQTTRQDSVPDEKSLELEAAPGDGMLTRRQFVGAIALAGAGLSLANLAGGAPGVRPAPNPANPRGSGRPMGAAFTNPVISGFHPDPSVCRVGDDFYLVNSSFEYTPGVPVFHSRDLVNWRPLGYCLTRESQLPLPLAQPSLGIYAPTIRHHRGTFYLITTNMDRFAAGGGEEPSNFFVTAEDPAGGWSEPVWLEQPGIDPSLLFDDDGRVYLTSAAFPLELITDPTRTDLSYTIIQSEIDVATGRLLTEPRELWSGTGGAYPEGPHLYKVGGRYYLMIAEGGTSYGHMETVARSDTPWGPWEPCPHNPVLTNRSLQSPIQATGHADLVELQDGSWWLVCLGVRPLPSTYLHHLGRETFLAPVTWDAEGWPHAGADGRIEPSLRGPNLLPRAWPEPAPRTDFRGPDLGPEWNFLRWPPPGSWSLDARPGFLRLVGTPARLDDGAGLAFVGRRQEHPRCEVATRLEFTPETDGAEAGLTVWMNGGHHYEIAVTRLEGTRHIIVRRRVGTLAATVAREPLEEGLVTLSVSATDAAGDSGLPGYTFAYRSGTEEPRVLGSGEARYLATEVAGGYTGVYFALYATAGGEGGAAPADFAWFEYRPG